MCGDICNTFVYVPDDEKAAAETKAMFKVGHLLGWGRGSQGECTNKI